MSAFLLVPGAPVRALDANGDPAAGAQLYVFEAGTSTPVTVYSDMALTAAHATPVVADSAGVFPPIYFDGPVSLKIRIDSAADATLSTLDNLTGLPTGLTGAAETGFDPTPGIPANDVQSAIEAVYGVATRDLSLSDPSIINGGFDIWQRGTSLSAAADTRYLADRWFTSSLGSTIAPSRQSFDLGQTDVLGEPVYFHRTVVASSSGATNFAVLSQRIESVRTHANQTVTLSFHAKADSSKNIAVECLQVFGTGGSPSARVEGIGSQIVALTSSWQKFAVQIPVPSIAGKTLGSDGNDHIAVLFWFDAGSNFSARAAGLGQQSGTFDIAQVQMEAGLQATEFRKRYLGEVYGLCLRYYETLRMGLASSAYGGSATGSLNVINWAVPKRATPTLTLTPDSGTGGAVLAGGTRYVFQSALHSAAAGATVIGDAEL